MSSSRSMKAISDELKSGDGFGYEDTVVAYYLAQLLRRERAQGQDGFVTSVAIQQKAHAHPMDDLVVEFDDMGAKRVLGLQIKKSITIGDNEKFHEIISAAVETQALSSFGKDTDRCGFVVEHVTDATLRSLKRLVDWASASEATADFETRFSSTGNAGQDERNLRAKLQPLIGTSNLDGEVSFYRHFAALHFSGLEEGGVLRTEIINRLQELVASNEDGQGVLLFDRLCRIARDWSGKAKKWTRASLLTQLRGALRLKVIPYFKGDVDRLNASSLEALNVVSEVVDDFHVERNAIQDKVAEKLKRHRVVSIGGLPGCGKSAVLKRFAENASAAGPILFLKNDRITGTSWSTFAASLHLSSPNVVALLQEIGSTGTPIIFIDGIDRVRPDQQGVILDILKAIHDNPSLCNWKVLVSSRDQGLEVFRTWFPRGMYGDTGIGEVTVNEFSEEEATELAKSKPNLQKLLFGNPSVQAIARRPFFAAVLARSIPEGTEPQSEIDLVTAWWARAGHDAAVDTIPQRQRALIDLAEKGVQNLGKGIPARELATLTIEQISTLRADKIIEGKNGDSSFGFTHDIFFEWAFFRLLIDLGNDWSDALKAAGEPPLLGRVVGLMAQDAFDENGRWSAGYRLLVGKNLRRQWQREWLTAPPFTDKFDQALEEFNGLLKADNFALFEKVLVWFQAQHTIPSPYILANQSPVEGMDSMAVADMLGWPSDFRAWGRLIDWIIGEAASLPVRLIPRVLEIFDVWQNALCSRANGRSKDILELANGWLLRFEKGELHDKSDGDEEKIRTLSREESSRLGKSLRTILLRSARSYPHFAKALYQRAIADDDLRHGTYDDLIAFSPTMVHVDPDLLANLAEAEFLKELPGDKWERERKERDEHFKRLAELRAIPKKKRTEQQNRFLDSTFFPIGMDSYDLDDVGIERYGPGSYHPTSALHEPFKSLFALNPAAALRLVRNLANHASKGWKQVYAINRKTMGTPIPVSVEFPWGKQEFWGDWRVYSWGMGHLAPNPLECAFLALSYWAFKEIENGRPASHVIKDIVEGNECYAVLGIALLLALETWGITETTLTVATCQRLWKHDIARFAQEPTKNVDIFGIGELSRLTGEKEKAKEFLDQRVSRKRNIIDLAKRFALGADTSLSEKFKLALARFPDELPYEYEEQKAIAEYTAKLKEDAEEWAGLGDIMNYWASQQDEHTVAVAYVPPKPPSEQRQKQQEEATTSLIGFSIRGWVATSLQTNKIGDGITIAQAVTHAKGIDTKSAFDTRDENPSSPQTVVASVATCVIRLGDPESEEFKWAWSVMERVEAMKEPEDIFSRSNHPWHPAVYLITALHHDRRSASPRPDSAEQLLKLTLHPTDNVNELAFDALFRDDNEHLRWIAGHLALKLSVIHRAKFENGAWNRAPGLKAREEALAAALAALKKTENEPMPVLPPAWVKVGVRGKRVPSEAQWQLPDVFFDGQTAAKLLKKMPLETWMASDIYKPLLEPLLLKLVSWAAESIMPSWQTEKQKRSDKRTDLFEWNHALGDILARITPFVSLDDARNKFVKPFMADDEQALSILARFADSAVCRHVFDAATIPANVIPLLDDCVSRVVNDPAFKPNRWRAGQVSGHEMPELIAALLFVNVGKSAPGAARFANGNWTEIKTIMPIIDRMVRAIGWSDYVMGKFLALCERAGKAYPVSEFGPQANAAIAAIGNSEEGWAGTLLPAKIAAFIEKQANWNFPLQSDDAQSLLRILDALIDLGDRRSAALEQDAVFKGIQVKSAAA